MRLNLKKMEKQVKENSLWLEKKMDYFIKTFSDKKFIVVHDGECYFTDTLENALKIGMQAFGADVGFVIEELTKNIPLVSSHVTI